jgi:deoxyribodipyrimidine photolyase
MDKTIFKNDFVSELARREFWQHIAHYFPETWGIEFQEKRR